MRRAHQVHERVAGPHELPVGRRIKGVADHGLDAGWDAGSRSRTTQHADVAAPYVQFRRKTGPHVARAARDEHAAPRHEAMLSERR